MRITLTQYGSAGPVEIDPSIIGAITPLEANRMCNGEEIPKRTRIDSKVNGVQWFVQESLAEIRAYLDEAGESPSITRSCK